HESAHYQRVSLFQELPQGNQKILKFRPSAERQSVLRLGRRDGQGQRHRRPARGRGRNELRPAVGEAAIRKGHYREAARGHIPGAGSQLSPQQKLDAAAKGGGIDGNSPGLMQREQRLSGRIGIAGERWQLRPATVLPLLAQEASRCLLDWFHVSLYPVEP